MDRGEVRVGIWDKDCARKREKAGWVFDLRQPCQGRERRSRERERGARGRGSSLLTKREGEKAASKASGGTVHRAGEEGEATAKKSWKEGDDGED